MSQTVPNLQNPPDYAGARDRMVDSQVRPNKVIDPRIIQAMRRLPRECFVPPAMAPLAYADEDVPLGNGRYLMEPMIIARLVQLLQARDGDAALVVGSGPGYGAALLHACGVRVTALEDDPALLAIARRLLSGLAQGVTLVEGPLPAGWPAAAPYDVILIEGAVAQVPDAFATQLKPGGRVAAVLAGPGIPGHGVLAEPVAVGGSLRLRAQPFFDAATPMLPQLAPRSAFTF